MKIINALLLIILGVVITAVYFTIIKKPVISEIVKPAVIYVEKEKLPIDKPPPIKKYRDGHIGGYFWRAIKGEIIKDIYEVLHRSGWRFGTQSKSKGYDNFLARIKKHNAGKIEDEKVNQKTTLDFSPLSRKKIKKPYINEQDYDFEWQLARVTVYMAGLYGDPWHNHRMKDIRFTWGCAVPQKAVRRLGLRDGDIIYVKSFGKLPLIDRVPRRSEKKHERIAINRGMIIDLVVDVNVRAMGIVTKREAYKLDKGICWVKVYRKKRFVANMMVRR